MTVQQSQATRPFGPRRGWRASQWLIPLACAVIVAILPLIGMSPYWRNQIILIAIYALIVSGLNLSYGFAGEISLGQVAVFAGGAYTAAMLYQVGITDLLIAILVSACVAVVLGLLTGGPGLRLSHFSLALTSFFLVFLIPYLVGIFKEFTGGTVGLGLPLGPTLFGVSLDMTALYLVTIVILVLWFAVFRNIVLSDFGVSLKVLRESPLLARSLGVSTSSRKLSAYVLAGIPAGVAGALYAHLAGYVEPGSFPLTLTIVLLAASVVGGSASIYGALIGAALLVFGPLQTAAFAQLSLIAYGVFLVLIGVVFSGGVVGLIRLLERRATRRRRRTGTAPARAGAATGDDPATGELTIPGERLALEGVSKSFGGVSAVREVTMVAEAGAVTAIMGANGAGKTTIINLVSGMFPPDAGEIRLGDRQIARLRADRVARLGVGRTFQTPLIPRSQSVLELVASGRLRNRRVSLLGAILRLPAHRRAQAADLAAARAALAFAGLGHLEDEDADSLPLGTRRLLEVVRSVAGEPNVLLLDEPAAGLDDDGIRELTSLIDRARTAGATVVLIEHNVKFLMSVADRVYAMELGRVIASGTPEEVRQDPRVISSYLGRAAAVERKGGPDA